MPSMCLHVVHTPSDIYGMNDRTCKQRLNKSIDRMQVKKIYDTLCQY